jgi:hypothetical protein
MYHDGRLGIRCSLQAAQVLVCAIHEPDEIQKTRSILWFRYAMVRPGPVQQMMEYHGGA